MRTKLLLLQCTYYSSSSRVTRPHGNNGVVKAKFASNIPPHAFGASVRVVRIAKLTLTALPAHVHNSRCCTPLRSDLLCALACLWHFPSSTYRNMTCPWPTCIHHDTVRSSEEAGRARLAQLGTLFRLRTDEVGQAWKASRPNGRSEVWEAGSRTWKAHMDSSFSDCAHPKEGYH